MNYLIRVATVAIQEKKQNIDKRSFANQRLIFRDMLRNATMLPGHVELVNNIKTDTESFWNYEHSKLIAKLA